MSFWKKLGKIALKAAPIAANFIPMGGPLASMAIRGGIGAAAGAAGGGKKGALIGGLMGAGTSAARSAMAARSAAGAASGAASGMPGTNIGIPTMTAAGSVLTPDTAANTGGSFINNLLNPDVLRSAARGIGSITQAAASNRGTELEAMMDADDQDIKMRSDRRTEESDILRKMQIAEYLASGGAGDPKPYTTASGHTIQPMSFAPRATTETERANAMELQKQLQARLHNPPTARDYDSRMKPSGGERIGNWLGPIADIAGEYVRSRNS
jgi:hypothetical protein